MYGGHLLAGKKKVENVWNMNKFARERGREREKDARSDNWEEEAKTENWDGIKWENEYSWGRSERSVKERWICEDSGWEIETGERKEEPSHSTGQKKRKWIQHHAYCMRNVVKPLKAMLFDMTFNSWKPKAHSTYCLSCMNSSFPAAWTLMAWKIALTITFFFSLSNKTHWVRTAFHVRVHRFSFILLTLHLCQHLLPI